MITISNLTVSYERNTVLKQLHWKIPLKQIHGLVGLNGSGKTTLLNTIYGTKRKDSGSIQILSKPVNKKQIAYLEAENYFYPRITGYEYLQIFKTQNQTFSIHNWNVYFKLPLQKNIDTYSTGMKKKLAFLANLCLDKEIFILDEPFNGVDLETNRKIKQILTILQSNGKTIIITSHILESLLSICDTIAYLNNAQIEFHIEKNSFDTIEDRIFRSENNTEEFTKLLN